MYHDGLVLYLGQGASGSRGMTAEVPSWGLKAGETYVAAFAVGGRRFTLIGTARTSNLMTFRAAPEFFEELKSDRPLELSANRRHSTVNLAGIEVATKRLTACVNEYAGRTLPLELRSVTPQIASPATSPTSPLAVPSIIVVERSSGHALLDEAAVEAVKVARIQPHHVNGKPQPVRVKVPISFVLVESERSPRRN